MGKLGLPGGVPVVHRWIGSDTHHTTAHSRLRRYNWVPSPWLGRWLEQRLGVKALVVPLTPELEPEVLPRSADRRVLIYCPQRREHKYGWSESVEIARCYPDVEFAVLQKGGEPELPNMVHLPPIAHEDMPRVYASARLLLRLTPSDGTSLGVQEALGFGRHAIWNWWLPGVTHVSTLDEAVEAVERLIDAPVYVGGAASAREFRAQADRALSAAIEEVLG
jgi:hypothetical protein